MSLHIEHVTGLNTTGSDGWFVNLMYSEDASSSPYFDKDYENYHYDG